MVWNINSTPAVSGLSDASHLALSTLPLPTDQPLLPFVTARSYGADSSGSSDSLAALQRASNAINNQGGGVLWLDPGSYLLSSRLILYSNTMLMGVRGQTVIKPITTWASGINILANNNFNFGIQQATKDNDIRIEGITFDYNGVSGIVGPLFANINRLRIIDCSFRNGHGNSPMLAVVCYNPGQIINDDCHLIGCYFDGTNVTSDVCDFNSGTAMRVERCSFRNGSGPSGLSCAFDQGLHIEGCEFSGTSGGTGLSLEATIQATVCNSKSSGNKWGIVVEAWETAAVIQSAQDISITGCTLYNNANNGINLSNPISNQPVGSSGVSITGNVISFNGFEGISITSTIGVSIVGNVIKNNSQGSAGTYYAIALKNWQAATANKQILIADNMVYDDQGSPTQSKFLQAQQYSDILVQDNSLYNITVGQPNYFSTLGDAGPSVAGSVIFRNNRNYNPIRALNTTSTGVSSPIMTANGQPTTGQSYLNVSGVFIHLYNITAGTVSQIQIDGVTVAGTSLVGQDIIWPPLSTVSFTFTVQPTYQAYGD